MCVPYRALSVWMVITASGMPTAQVILAGDAARIHPGDRDETSPSTMEARRPATLLGYPAIDAGYW